MRFSIKILTILALIYFPNSAFSSIIVFDDFEYSVNRNTPNDALKFRKDGLGQWDGVKSSQNDGQSGARGYLYTVSSIPGYSGTFPGSSSQKVLCMEFLPESLGFQTDAYLALGDMAAPQNTIPANVWYQYWIYINNYGEQQTAWARDGGKWLYPCINGSPSCSPSYVSYLGLLKPISYNPFNEEASNANVYHGIEATGANYAPGSDPGVWKLGHNRAAYGGLLQSNRWTLVKIHIDHTGNSPLAANGQGVYEEWHKPYGGDWVKVAEWIGGSTPNFTWDVTRMGTGYNIGNKSFKLGTTFNGRDSWIYVDDFVIATSEADLPAYDGEDGSGTGSNDDLLPTIPRGFQMSQ
ncbi:hypothetical protein [Desulfofustis limnaeus]|uniref:Uncharacterized protein n=1 Tax=Desulfofustis limnaeus TaxID=2740163 RepID=A0ABM7W9F2_9BACT|nr:hypothetical protein [Desulfofustis limnaeus]BDD87604.1 hypothetical protein DPPLL_19690 [Desulfofustis limnaeus]